MSARDPVADLRRIAFLLERANEATFRVRAFRAAAAAAAELGPAELTRRAADGTLRKVSGIGEATARCVEESLHGEEPAYLRRLAQATGDAADRGAGSSADARDVGKAAAAGKPGGAGSAGTGGTGGTGGTAGAVGSEPGAGTAGGAALRSALLGDCHLHSDWSDGGGSIEEMALAAVGLGHEYMVLTDHSPRLTVARGLSADRLRQQLEVVGRINAALPPGFRVLTGIEVDILADGSLDQDPALLAELDVVVGSLHSRLRDPPDVMTNRMLTAVTNPHLDILGHCTGRKVDPAAVGAGSGGDRAHRAVRTRPESTFDAAAVFAACAQHDKAVEINCRPDRLDPPIRLLDLAVAAGCRFAVDTDAHAPGQLDWLGYGCERAARSAVDPDHVVNTWPAERLVAWARSHD